MANEKRLIAYDPITFESFTRHSTKHREPNASSYDDGYVDAVQQIEDWLDANTVDAVEVVRCKDCKYAVGHDGIHKTVLCQQRSSYPQPWDEMPFEGFCSHGERRTDV